MDTGWFAARTRPVIAGGELQAGSTSSGLEATVKDCGVATVILSFRVSRGCDLRRPVVDSVADGTLAA